MGRDSWIRTLWESIKEALQWRNARDVADAEATLRIGELARRADVSEERIRQFETGSFEQIFERRVGNKPKERIADEPPPAPKELPSPPEQRRLPRPQDAG